MGQTRRTGSQHWRRRVGLKKEKTIKNASNIYLIQEFSSLVKQINKDKPKVPKPEKKDEKKEINPRSKALEYSKNVPKPTVRPVMEKVEEP